MRDLYPSFNNFSTSRRWTTEGERYWGHLHEVTTEDGLSARILYHETTDDYLLGLWLISTYVDENFNPGIFVEEVSGTCCPAENYDE